MAEKHTRSMLLTWRLLSYDIPLTWFRSGKDHVGRIGHPIVSLPSDDLLVVEAYTIL